MKTAKPDKPNCAYVVILMNGREIVKTYRDDRRAMAAAMVGKDVVRVILVGGRIIEKADLDAM